MTSDRSVSDIRAARAHLQDSLVGLSGQNLKDAQKAIADLTKLLTKLGTT